MATVTDDQKGQLIKSSWFYPMETKGLVLTYSFGGTEIPYWKGYDYVPHWVKENTFKPLSGPQKAAFEEAVKVWEAVADIHLTPGMPYIVDTGLMTLGFGDIVVVGGELYDPNDPKAVRRNNQRALRRI